jgi:hypothetical protein
MIVGAGKLDQLIFARDASHLTRLFFTFAAKRATPICRLGFVHAFVGCENEILIDQTLATPTTAHKIYLTIHGWLDFMYHLTMQFVIWNK